MRTVVNPSNDSPYIMFGLLGRPTSANRPIQISKPSPLDEYDLARIVALMSRTRRLSILRPGAFAHLIFDESYTTP